MKCIDPKMKKLVSLYQFNMLGEEEKFSVEDHLLECDACFEEVYRLCPAVEIVEEKPEFFLNALQRYAASPIIPVSPFLWQIR